ncbi:MAG: ABC transporter substrate-binding protein [Acidobacteriota bacterium]
MRSRVPARFALLVLLLAGCGPGPPAGRGDADGPPGYGGRFVFPLPIEPSTLNYVVGTDMPSVLVQRLVAEGLVDHDADLRPVPRLAESWNFSPDGRVLTFRLRRGVRFHDGSPFTSADVLHTYRRIIDPASRAVGRLDAFLPVEKVETPDPLTVRVTYRHPYAPALRGWEAPILPRHLDTSEDLAASPLNRAPVGTGPFRFASWEAGQRIVLTANEAYWGGRPYLDSFVFQVIPSQETRLQALLAGEVDYAHLTPVQWEAHGGSASFRRRFRSIRYVPLFLYYIAWRSDGSNPFFGDPAVRRALSLALDRQGYVSTVLRGMGRVADSPFHPQQLAPDPRSPGPVYDPAAAAARLEAAGWRVDPKTGVRARDGVPFRFTLLVYSGGEDHLRFSQVAQESLRRLGVEMSIERLDWPALWTRLKEGEFQAALSGTVPGLDPDSWYGMLHSSQIDGGQNYAAFRDARVDAWLDEGRRSIDAHRRLELYRRVERRVRDLQPYTFLFFPIVRAAVSRRVRGLSASPLGIIDQYPGAERIYVTGAGAR